MKEEKTTPSADNPVAPQSIPPRPADTEQPAPQAPSEQEQGDESPAIVDATPAAAGSVSTEQVAANHNSDVTPDAEEVQRLIEKAEKEAYARGRAEAVDEYLNPNPFYSGLHGAEAATPADPDLQRILQTRKHVW